MNLLEFGSLLIPSETGGARSASPRKAYDDRAGAAVLRRTGKGAPAAAPLRGDQGSALLAARRKTETEDRLGRQLRDFYQKMLREPVPERLVALVESLDDKDRDPA